MCHFSDTRQKQPELFEFFSLGNIMFLPGTNLHVLGSIATNDACFGLPLKRDPGFFDSAFSKKPKHLN